jgi:predicted tellurium resistance membrane protein TerC
LISKGKLSLGISSHSLWLLVLQIEIIDLIFSLDNVIVALALPSDYWTESVTQQRLLAR